MTGLNVDMKSVFERCMTKCMADLAEDLKLIEPEPVEVLRIRKIVEKEIKMAVGRLVYSIQFGQVKVPTVLVTKLGAVEACKFVESICKSIADRISSKFKVEEEN